MVSYTTVRDGLPDSFRSESGLIDAFYTKRVGTFTDVAGITILLYDFFLTLPEDIRYMWRKPISIATVLFFLTRYLPFLDIPVTIVIHLSTHDMFSPRICSLLWNVQATTYMVGIHLADGLLLIRTIAVWNKNRIVLSLAALMVVNSLGVLIYTTRYNIVSFPMAPNPFDNRLYPGCLLNGNSNHLWIWYVILLVEETIIFALTIIHAIHQGFADAVKLGSTSLHGAVYRDGSIFYFYVFATSIINIVFLASTTGPSTVYLPALHRYLHAVFAERLILNIREAGGSAQSAEEPVAFLSHAASPRGSIYA